MIKLINRLFGYKTLDDILGVFNRAKADLEKFIHDHEQRINIHNDELIALTEARAALQDAKDVAAKVHGNLTSLLNA